MIPFSPFQRPTVRFYFPCQGHRGEAQAHTAIRRQIRTQTLGVSPCLHRPLTPGHCPRLPHFMRLGWCCSACVSVSSAPHPGSTGKPTGACERLSCFSRAPQVCAPWWSGLTHRAQGGLAAQTERQAPRAHMHSTQNSVLVPACPPKGCHSPQCLFSKMFNWRNQ